MSRSVSAAMAVVLAASADGSAAVRDVIESALSAFDRGDVAAAREDLGAADLLLAAVRSETLGRFLPAAPSGWSREDMHMERSAPGAGGGVLAAATYRTAGCELTITLVADSPMACGMVAMVSGIASLHGGSPVRVRGTDFSHNGRELHGVVGRAVALSVGGDVPLPDKIAVVSSMDLDGLAAFGAVRRLAAA